MKQLLALILISLAAGCSILPSTKHDSAATKAADNIASQQAITVEKIVDISPAIPATNGLPMAYHAAVKVQANSGQNAASALAATGASSITIPLGVKLGLLAAGVLACIIVFGILRRKFVALDQGIRFADESIASRIRAARERASATRDESDMARANAEVAELESLRGRLLAKVK
jgi:hypothetical protein